MTDDETLRARYVEKLRATFGDRATGIARDQRDAASGDTRREWDRILLALKSSSVLVPSVVGALMMARHLH